MRFAIDFFQERVAGFVGLIISHVAFGRVLTAQNFAEAGAKRTVVHGHVHALGVNRMLEERVVRVGRRVQEQAAAVEVPVDWRPLSQRGVAAAALTHIHKAAAVFTATVALAQRAAEELILAVQADATALLGAVVVGLRAADLNHRVAGFEEGNRAVLPIGVESGGLIRHGFDVALGGLQIAHAGKAVDLRHAIFAAHVADGLFALFKRGVQPGGFEPNV